MSEPLLDLTEVAAPWAPALGPVDARLRGAALATWQARMLNEYGSARVFEALAGDLRAAGIAGAWVDECRRFADEERHHGVLCAAVVVALGGQARAPQPPSRPYPRHLDAPPRARALRNLIHVCCMSETVATSLIGAERLEMPQGALRELLGRIYADEVGHARFGWRLLETLGPELDAPERTAIERYLPGALRDVERHQHAHLPACDAPPGGAAYGLCSGNQARRLLAETVEEVIRPGLRRWFAC